MESGKFVISLDFELMWGVRDKKNLKTYGDTILKTHSVIEHLLDVFKKHQINATFSIVGFLFFKNKSELLKNIPIIRPSYINANLNPYSSDYLNGIRENDKYHFASHLIEKIKKEINHEISTHTFSHYYCLEEGQSAIEFSEDLKKVKDVAKSNGIEIQSIVFPRNQFNDDYQSILADSNINIYRGTEECWFYKEKAGKEDTLVRRAFRLVDAYFNISGHHCYPLKNDKNLLTNIPSSRLLRAYNPKLKFLEKLKRKRIKNSMTYAAKNKLTYHLWWHPHNFGSNVTNNKLLLEDILKHYDKLKKLYKFESITMIKAGEIKKKNK